MQEDRNFFPEVVWIYGKTGVGKSYSIIQHEKDLWVSSNIGAKWLRYQNQEAVLIDDFRASQVEFAQLLRILDGYTYYADVKYGDRTFNSKRIYITSNRHPGAIYQGSVTDEDVDQLLDRIDCILHFVTDTVTEVKKGLIPPFLTNRVEHGGRQGRRDRALCRPPGARADNPTPGPSPPLPPGPTPLGEDCSVISDETLGQCDLVDNVWAPETE